MVEAATLRSGYDLKDSTGFADRIESMLRRAMGIAVDEKVEDEPMDDDNDLNLDATKPTEDENVIDDDAEPKSTKSSTVCPRLAPSFVLTASLSCRLESRSGTR